MALAYTRSQIAKGMLLWVLLFVSLPFSPIHLIGTLIYQFGCVHGTLSPTSRVATFVVCVFLAIAWIPFVNFGYYLNFDFAHRNDKGVQLDGVVPLGTLAVFYIWGSVVAFRIYSIDDSYEEEKDRRNVQRLCAFPLNPPIIFLSEQHGDETEVLDAYELYMALKRENPANATTIAVCVGVVLSCFTITLARVVQRETAAELSDGNGLYLSEPTFTLASIYYSGMFLVFFSTFAFVATLYINHVRIVWQLTFLASGEAAQAAEHDARLGGGSPLTMLQGDAEFNSGASYPLDATAPANNDSNGSTARRGRTATRVASGPLEPAPTASQKAFNAPISGPTLQEDEEFMRGQLAVGGSVVFRSPRRATDAGSNIGGISCTLQPYNLGHIRAWDEVRRVAAAYIAAPDSTLNAFLTPTLWFAVGGMVAGYLYLIISLLINFTSIGPFIVVVVIIIVIFAVFIAVMVAIAKKARRHFKFHNVIISRILFDVACEVDTRLPLVQQGIEPMADRRPGMELLEMKDLVRLHDSLLALLSFMDSTSPRPLILGIEQRHVRYAVAYALLASANVLFVVLLRHMISDDDPCFYDEN
jgi:hypothetical protein